MHYSSKEVRQKLEKIEGWKLYRSKSIQRKFHLKDFDAAMSFINKIADIARKLNHHPDILAQNFSEVTIRTITHSEGGVTNKDLELAKAVNDEFDKTYFKGK